MTEKELEYWPTGIKRVKRGNRWIHIDPETKKQTFPSWAKRARREIISRDGVTKKMGERERQDLHVLMAQLRQNEKDLDSVELQDAIDALMEALDIGQMEARRRINTLWLCEAFEMSGAMHMQSKRYMRQSLHF